MSIPLRPNGGNNRIRGNRTSADDISMPMPPATDEPMSMWPEDVPEPPAGYEDPERIINEYERSQPPRTRGHGRPRNPADASLPDGMIPVTPSARQQQPRRPRPQASGARAHRASSSNTPLDHSPMTPGNPPARRTTSPRDASMTGNETPRPLPSRSQQQPRGGRQVHTMDSTKYARPGMGMDQQQPPAGSPRTRRRSSENPPAPPRAQRNGMGPMNQSARDEYGRPVYNRFGNRIQWYPGYTGTDYPKGLGHGPMVTRRNRKTNKPVKIEGLSWERLDEDQQRDLDHEPYDEAGMLRIYLEDSSSYMVYEYGSDESNDMERDDLRSKLNQLRHTDSGIGYKNRPQLDKDADYLKDYEPGEERPDPGSFKIPR